MRKISFFLAAVALLAPVTLDLKPLDAQASQIKPPEQKPLDVYFLDTEGGQATLFVSPSGQSMLVDTGFAGNQGMPPAPASVAAAGAPPATPDPHPPTPGLRLAN